MAIVTGQDILAADALTLRGLYNELLFPVLTEEAPQEVNLGKADANTDYLAHSIVHPEALKIFRVGLAVKSTTLNPGIIYCEIWDDAAGDPNAVIANGSSSIAQASVLADEVNWFTFGTPPSLTANTKYWVVFRTAAGDATNYYTVYNYDGKPSNGKGFWGVDTIGKYYDSGVAWINYTPPITVIRGCRQELYGA